MFTMPTLIYMSEDLAKLAQLFNIPAQQKNPNVKGAVFIECEYIPEKGNEAEVAKQVAAQFCSRCGFKKDADQRQYQLLCFNPKSPYLAEFKKKLGLT